ncbi:ferritin-like domain-containing protein [Pedobacter sp. SYSU D00535]|uniref:ferritin-like domain-containing protein n=1 Tax=Pedobacter sp. SYSU D00535 TaxID=2810308 RepID=UPI001A97CE74|nr:ferritin-like domain-containing protein [Pedobacter sp. SYSU D00535]
MNFYNILNEIEKIDGDVYERLSPRRRAIKALTGFGGKVALSALPFALGTMFKKAYGQTNANAQIIDVLNFALTLEYLEAEFYTTGLSRATLVIPSTEARNALTTIRDHETAHVNFLKTAIQSMNGTPVNKPNFDFTAKGNFPTVFTNYDTFLAVSQAFEDTGVRAYKGQAGNLMPSDAVLTAALKIHSVEARHAAHVRRMRAARGAQVKPWITLNQSGIASNAVQPIYNGEEVVTQANVAITGINGTSVSANAASEAFDEPLTKEQVLAIVTPFLA